MSPSTVAIIVALISTLLYILRAASSRTKHRKSGHKPPPPGPPFLPLIGNLHMMGTLPHRTLETLARKYGPIMSVRFGLVPAIVVSSPEAAELFLKTHDTVFANRLRSKVVKHFSYDFRDMAFAEYGGYWRNLRKLYKMELLSASKLELLRPIKGEELRKFVESLKNLGATELDLSAKVGELLERMMFKVILGRNTDNVLDFKKLAEEFFGVLGAFNIADCFPFLGVIDFQGLGRRSQEIHEKMDRMLENVLNDRQGQSSTNDYKDFVDILLPHLNKQLNGNDEPLQTLDRTTMKAILVDMVLGSYETSSTAIEWILSEVIRNPNVMKRLQDELEDVVGLKRMVEETDLSKFVYLDMVVKESLRLHPVGPFIPRQSREDIVINGYYIPKGSRVMINTWAIGRDPKAWSKNALEFCPERFMNRDVDLQGRHFQLIPFGSGRRICPGLNLGLSTTKLVVAQLVHCFKWDLPNGMLPNELNMMEKRGISLQRAQPLIATPSYRLLD